MNYDFKRLLQPFFLLDLSVLFIALYASSDFLRYPFQISRNGGCDKERTGEREAKKGKGKKEKNGERETEYRTAGEKEKTEKQTGNGQTGKSDRRPWKKPCRKRLKGMCRACGEPCSLWESLLNPPEKFCRACRELCRRWKTVQSPVKSS